MSIPPPGYETPQASPPTTEPELGWPSRQDDDNAQYWLKSVQVLRGRENSTKAKWHNQGWEFVSEDRGTLRTELNFRRAKPKGLGDHFQAFVAVARRLPAKPLQIVAAGCVLILLAGMAMTAGTQGGGATPTPSVAQIETSGEPPAEPTVTDSAGTLEPDAADASGSDAEQILSAANSKEFAALLADPEPCNRSIASFAAEHEGRTIMFDGSIANVANHGGYDTRFDFLIAPGDKGPRSTVGPTFKFEDVNVHDLELTGGNIPASIDAGDRFRFAAEVVEYDPGSCLFFLSPVATGVR